jgi:hypothetical protein
VFCVCSQGWLSYAEFVSFIQLRKNGGIEMPSEPASPRNTNNNYNNGSGSVTPLLRSGVASIASGNGETVPTTPRSGRAQRSTILQHQHQQRSISSQQSSDPSSVSISSPSLQINPFARLDNMTPAGRASSPHPTNTTSSGGSSNIGGGGGISGTGGIQNELIGGIRRTGASTSSGSVTPLLTGGAASSLVPTTTPPAAVNVNGAAATSTTSSISAPPWDVGVTSTMTSLPARTSVTANGVDDLIRVVASAIHASSLRTVRAAFDYFDRDHRQLINKANFREALTLLTSEGNIRSVHVDDTVIDQLYDRYDTTRNGSLSISQFSRLLTGK